MLLLSLFPIYIAWKKSEKYDQLDWKTGKIKINKAEIIFGILYFTICIVEICLAINPFDPVNSTFILVVPFF